MVAQDEQMNIYQIFYKQGQKQFLDPKFIPYDNTANACNDWCEWRIINEAYMQELHRTCRLLGFLSWKFKEKTGVDGDTLRNIILKNPGYDVYFINPYHDAMVTWGYSNIWKEAEASHSGISSFVQEIHSSVGIDLNIESFVTLPEETCYCNYWVGNERFWDEFMEYAGRIHRKLEIGLSEESRKMLEQSRAFSKQGVTLLPFIMERLFTTFLAMSRGNFHTFRISRPTDQDYNYTMLLPLILHVEGWKKRLLPLSERGQIEELDELLQSLRNNYLQIKNTRKSEKNYSRFLSVLLSWFRRHSWLT